MSLKKFQFYRLLGKGSFGQVYLVKYNENGQFYAMKMLEKQKVISSNHIRYAKTEKNILQIMKHPFIVSLNFAFQTKNKLVMVMDYCPKGDLSKLLKHYVRIPETYAKTYIAEVLLALEALHQESIVFRDLKPENVVLDESGHAMLTDFGLSKQGIKDNISRSFCGSLAYLAPEMLYKVGHSRMVDWYLLGVLTYELIVGVTPYYSNKKEQLFENIKSGPLMIPKTLSSQSKSFLRDLLCRNPSKRLGIENDAADIKKHQFFEGIDWNKVYRKECPVLGVNYIQNWTEMEPDKSLLSMQRERKDRNNIENWTFIQPSQ